MKIRVVWEGRTRDEHLNALQRDYAERISHFTAFEIEERRGSPRPSTNQGKMTAGEARLAAKSRDCFLVLLDVRGEEWSSEKFAAWLGQQALRGVKEIAFVVGGAEGFSNPFRQRGDLLLSLSRMTLTHDWARALLLEQIYRGFTILRGHPYPR
jgi:23S rRNA (pseudouridine1915-N3)-methyltransferase